MIDKIKGLKDKNKILYYVLLPILGVGLLVAFVAKILMDSNIEQAKEDIKDTQLNDIELEKQQKEAERKAKEAERKAKEHRKKAEKHEKDSENNDVDENWHLKE